ncbi:MAG: hypothetical protein ACYSUI_13350 [Planctomycetota bacterium]
MSADADSRERASWLESCSFVQIFRTFRLAIHPTKLILALAGLVLTLVWGGLLDWAWRRADHGVANSAVWSYVTADSSGPGHVEEAGSTGIFTAWRQYEALCVESAVASVIRGQLWGGGLDTASALGSMRADAGADSRLVAASGLVPCLILMAKGMGWLVTQHWLFALLLLLGALAIWALAGGAICRVAAVQYAKDERVGLREALTFARKRYFSGFLLSPLLPVLMVAFVGFIMALGGLFLRIPYLGDVLGSLLFVLAILGGAGIALVVIGALAGGSLFWPTIAAEGSESLDAVSRSFNYVGTTPWRTLFYGLVATVYGSLCFLFVKWFAYLMLAGTHAFVSFGTSPCGLWERAEGQSKLDVLWPAPMLGQLHSGTLTTSGIETFSGAVVAIWVFLVILLVWAFLASFYFSGSTVIYFLLRRDNDAMDLEDVYIEEYEEGEFKPTTPPSAEEPAPEPSGGVPLTVEGQDVAPTTAASSADDTAGSTGGAGEDAPADTGESPQGGEGEGSDRKDDDSPSGDAAG